MKLEKEVWDNIRSSLTLAKCIIPGDEGSSDEFYHMTVSDFRKFSQEAIAEEANNHANL